MEQLFNQVESRLHARWGPGVLGNWSLCLQFTCLGILNTFRCLLQCPTLSFRSWTPGTKVKIRT